MHAFMKSMVNKKLAIYFSLFLACLVVSFDSLNNKFIFDDHFFIVKNLYIQDISHIPKLFKTDAFHFQHTEDPSLGVYYRPLQELSFAADYFFWKLNPPGYRLTNIFLHSLNSFLLFLLVSLILKDELIALISSLLFCIHPVSEALVTFISGRGNFLETTFTLLSLITFANYCLDGRKADYKFSLFFFILALLSREGALLLPIFILLCAPMLNVDRKKIVLYLVPYLFISALYFILRTKLIPCDKFNLEGIFSVGKVSEFIRLAQDYVGQLILPAGFQAAFLKNNIAFKLILSFISLFLTAYLLVRAVILKDRVSVFSLGFYFIGVLPLLQLSDTIAYFGKILSEHYVYTASAGFFIFIAYLIVKLHLRFQKTGKFIFAAIVSGYCVMSILNNKNYKDDLAYYNHVVDVDKDHVFTRVNLGTLYYEKKQYAQAEKQASLVLAKDPRAWDAYLLLGNIAKDKGDWPGAIRLYERVISLNPRASEAFNNLGLIYQSEHKESQAIDNFKKAIQINPEATWALQNLANLLFDKSSYEEALALYGKILKLQPDNADILVRVGVILAASGDLKKAESIFKEALRLDPDSTDALCNLGSLYGNSGQFDKAVSLWKRALILSPNDENIRKNIDYAAQLIEKAKR